MKNVRITKNIRTMKKIIMTILVCMMALCLFACKKKEEKVEYNDKEGVAEGKVELSGEKPKINISNIKAKVGADIDFLSSVVIEDEEKFEDLKVWVDASAVDIYEPGDYKAKYTFEYDGKSFEHYIIVTIMDDGEESAGDSTQVADSNDDAGNANNNAGNANNNAGNVNNTPETQTSAIGDGQNNQQNADTTKNQGNVGQQATNKPDATTKNQNNAGQATTTKKPNTTTANQATTTKKPTTQTTTANNASSETTRRQMITSSGNTTTEAKNIGYSYINLLSGSTVSIKSTTEKYILLTRTDVSYITKNGVDYKVSKLVIRYNTGEERTLETVEEKWNQ